MLYLSVEELKTKNVVDEIKNSLPEDDNRLLSLLKYCTSIIESYVGYAFTSEEDLTIYVDGEGRNKIALPKRIYNIKSVSSVYGYNYSITSLRIVGDSQKYILNLRESFAEGYDNIEVYGDFGWEVVPDEIIECLVILCNGNYNLLNDLQKLESASGPFESEKIGDYQYSLKKGLNNVTGDYIRSTGNTTIDQILDKYRTLNEFSIGVI